jgi:UDP-2,3-diacylglucosamine pyrophosphatase LpxH
MDANQTDVAGTAQAALNVRTVWISDIHLGTPGCQANALLEFLRTTECDTLYLVGDIIDGWQLRRSWYWPQAHNDVVQKILRKARKGTRVVFVPGNHDEFARRYVEHNFGGVDVVYEAVHETVDGRRLLVIHGDHFDGVIQCAKWLAYVGDIAYEFTLKANSKLNALRARLGLPYWSLSRYLKLKVKRAVSYVSDFESAVAREARKRVLYCNDGDWVESLTALVEHHDGQLEIIDRSLDRQPVTEPASDSLVFDPGLLPGASSRPVFTPGVYPSPARISAGPVPSESVRRV